MFRSRGFRFSGNNRSRDDTAYRIPVQNHRNHSPTEPLPKKTKSAPQRRRDAEKSKKPPQSTRRKNQRARRKPKKSSRTQCLSAGRPAFRRNECSYVPARRTIKPASELITQRKPLSIHPVGSARVVPNSAIASLLTITPSS